MLQYRTAGDERVRESHALLNGITLPKDDPFWQKFNFPNGWGCRCRSIQVLANKYPKSDSKKAISAGMKATEKQPLFRFNPGATGEIFPPKHPYEKVKGAQEAVKKTTKK